MTRFSSFTRNAILTVHIGVSVGLLGDSAGFLAVAIRMGRSDTSVAILEQARVLNMFAMVFGIPLSVAAILSGVALGLGTKWGVFQYPWVVAKLVLIVTVMMVGGFVIGPALTTMLAGIADRRPQLITAAAYDVVALSIATILSVFKPGRQFGH